MDALTPTALIVAVMLLAYLLLRLRPKKVVSGPPVRIDGSGRFSQRLVGTAKYQHALETLAGGHTKEGVEAECLAQVVPERARWFGPRVVRVEIRGQIVGYLSRGDAERFHKRMVHAGLAGRTVICKALIIGGWDRGQQDHGSFGVKLDLASG